MSERNGSEHAIDGEVEMAGGYPAHQCFKTKARTTYCSTNTVQNHAAGATWIGQCMAHFGITAADLLGTPFLSNDVPAGATTYP